jgi:alpha-amylase/alpha-mannosidase (GH57 family)
MTKITWVNLLHFYQPATASNQTVLEAAEKSYKKIIGILKKNPKIRFTLNLTGCLLEKLVQLGYNNLIADIKTLKDRKQIELTGTAAFHPILPLMPNLEIKRNIQINEQILKKHFGNNFRATGFFPPELAFDQKTAKIIADFDYKWLALDEISAHGKLNKLNFNKLYLDKRTGLKIFFRDRALSKSYVPEKIIDLIKKNYQGLALTATDAELYGLRHIDWARSLEKLVGRPEIKTLTVSEFLASLKERVALEPSTSSWETLPNELKRGQPFILWQNKKNKVQAWLWQLAKLAMATVNRHQNDANYSWARSHLDRGLASCTFWWASARDFKLFSAISWSPDEIERGANELIRSIRSLAKPSTKAAKIAGEKLYLKIKQLIWHKHWHHYWIKKNIK